MWDFNRTELYTFRNFHIPSYMMEGLQRYIEDHVSPGKFLSAVIKNDLRGAIDMADDQNIQNLPAYVAFLYNHAPISCWGSEENFNKWLKEK